MPLLQLFPLALDQLVNQRLTQEKAKSSSLQNDPEILKRLDAIKEELVTTAYLQKTINDQLTDERLQQAYESYAAAYVPVEEARASHILVEDESTAKDLLSKLKAAEILRRLRRKIHSIKAVLCVVVILVTSQQRTLFPFLAKPPLLWRLIRCPVRLCSRNLATISSS